MLLLKALGCKLENSAYLQLAISVFMAAKYVLFSLFNNTDEVRIQLESVADRIRVSFGIRLDSHH